jgi:hypothetical protein
LKCMILKSFNIFELTKININPVVPIITVGLDAMQGDTHLKKYLYLLTRISLKQ